MTDDSMNRFEQEHLKRWWETTRHYLFADMKSLLGTAAAAEDRWSPPADGQPRWPKKVYCQSERPALALSQEREGKTTRCGNWRAYSSSRSRSSPSTPAFPGDCCRGWHRMATPAFSGASGCSSLTTPPA